MSSTYEDATCHYFSSAKCASCSLLGVAAGSRLRSKEARVLGDLQARGIVAENAEPIRSPKFPWGSRCKTKVNVTGTLARPSLGIVRKDLSTQDLSECPLTPLPVQNLLLHLKEIIQDARLFPYDIQARTGELKNIIVIHNHDMTEGILRFVLRSSEAISRISKSIDLIQSKHPWVTVISCNIQPLPAALLEGPDETILTKHRNMRVRYNNVELSFAPQSFIQVTHEIAAKLYDRAATYVRTNSFTHALDLFCGVGGFSLSIAPSVKRITGVEVTPSAVESAQLSANKHAISHARFIAQDVEVFLSSATFDDVDLVIVNPPRRGLSTPIIHKLLEIAPRSIIYSSCDPETFARDCAQLLSNYALKTLAPFDMFPMTRHCEVLGILEII